MRSTSAAGCCASCGISAKVARRHRGGRGRGRGRSGRRDQAAIASRLAAEIYGLEILRTDIEDAEHNTTRFIVLAREPIQPPPDEGPVITSFLFQVRNVPAALYKALGGFATNGVNMVKLESYVDAGFNQAQFYAEVVGHPEQAPVRQRVRGAGVLLARCRAARASTRPHPFRFRKADPPRLDCSRHRPRRLVVQAEQAGIAADRGGVDADRALGREARADSAGRRLSGRCPRAARRRTAAPRPRRR